MVINKNRQRGARRKESRHLTRWIFLSSAFALLSIPAFETNVDTASISPCLEKNKQEMCPKTCSTHITEGVFVNYTFVGMNGCVHPFMNLSFLGDSEPIMSMRENLWIHFVGDSDTRGMVMALLRFVYPPLREAKTVRDFACACNCVVDSMQGTASCTNSTIKLKDFVRISFIDFQFLHEVGYSKSLLPYISVSHVWPVPETHRLLASKESSSNWTFRVSFEMRGPPEDFNHALKHWSGKPEKSLPDLFYLNAGAWWWQLEDNIEQKQKIFDEAIYSIRQLSLMRHSKIIYGTSLPWRYNKLDQRIISDLSETSVSVMDRLRFSQIIMDGLSLQADDNHAPLIVNLYDAQRLARILFPYLEWGGYGSYIPRFFHENCSTNNNPDFYIGTWTQHCQFF